MRRSRANAGVARILETVIAASIIFIAFTAAAFFVSNSRTAVVQDNTDLNRLGYNVLSRITESGTIQATVGKQPQPPDAAVQLKAFVQNALPSAMLFNFTVSKYQQNGFGQWVTTQQIATVSNTDSAAFSNLISTSSTPLIYTAPEDGQTYYLVLVLAYSGESAR